jgi:hypothetical protein
MSISSREREVESWAVGIVGLSADRRRERARGARMAGWNLPVALVMERPGFHRKQPGSSVEADSSDAVKLLTDSG